MSVRKATAVIGIVLVCASSVFAQANMDPSRYDVVIQNNPFGVPPEPPKPATPPGPPPEDPFKNIKYVGMNRSTAGIRVGLLDITVNPPKSIYLRIGDTEEGITLLDADYDLESARIRKQGKEKWISYSGYFDTKPGSSPVSVAASSSGAQAGGTSAGRPKSYIDRIRERQQAVRQRTVEMPQLQGEALEKHLQDYNMELIRAKGEKGPPLPIPLTPEQDKQLVEEGVLPPQE